MKSKEIEEISAIAEKLMMMKIFKIMVFGSTGGRTLTPLYVSKLKARYENHHNNINEDNGLEIREGNQKNTQEYNQKDIRENNQKIIHEDNQKDSHGWPKRMSKRRPMRTHNIRVDIL